MEAKGSIPTLSFKGKNTLSTALRVMGWFSSRGGLDKVRYGFPRICSLPLMLRIPYSLWQQLEVNPDKKI